MNETSDILHQVLERPEAEWDQAIEEQCQCHPALAEELRRRFEILRESGFVAGRPQTEVPRRLGQFVLGRVLGQGGMGVVYEARQERLHRDVAVKLVRPENLFFPGARERFRREIEAVASLSHPGIVSIFTVGETDGVPFFAMELVRGTSLDNVLKELAGKPVAELGGRDLATLVARAARVSEAGLTDPVFEGDWQQVCLAIGRKLAEALTHAHARGVVHRDVKPSNVLITPEGRVVLLDFGLALPPGVDRMTREGSEVGSIPYMAPEQLRGESGDARTDVYSLGVTLRELLSFHHPFLAADRELTRRRILQGDGDAVQRCNHAVSWELATVLAMATDVQAKNRYQSAAELAVDLGNVDAHRPITARPAGTLRRVVRWSQRRPALATALCLGLLTAIGTPIAVAASIAAQRDRALAAEAAEQEKSYEASLAAANAAVRGNDAREARRRLAACPVHKRGFEWHHLATALDGSLAVMRGHADEVTAVALTADARLLASGGNDGSVLLWDVRSGALLHRFDHHMRARVRSLVFSADDQRLWIHDHVHTVSVVDVHARSVVAERRAGSARERVFVGTHAACILVGTGGWDLMALDPASLQPRAQHALQHVGTPPYELVATDGKHVCQVTDGELEIWDLATGQRCARVPVSNGGGTRALALNDVGTLVAVGDGRGHVSVHRVSDGSLVQAFSGRAGITDVTAPAGTELAFDRSGDLLAQTGASGTLCVFEVRSGTLLSERPGHDGRAHAAAFAGPGLLCATAGADQCIRLWSPFSGLDVQVLEGHAGSVRGLAITGSGRLLSVSEDGSMRAWDEANGMPVRVLGGYRHHVNTLAVTPDGGKAFSSYHNFLFSTDVGRLEHSDTWNLGSWIVDLAVAADGRTLLVATADDTALWLEPDNRRVLRELRGHRGMVRACALDGDEAITGGSDGKLLRWDLSSEAPPRIVSQGPMPIRAVELLADGRLAVARGTIRNEAAPSDAGEVALLQPDGRALWIRPCTSPPLAVQALPDGSRIVTGHLDGFLTVWEANTGAQLFGRRLAPSPIRALAVEASGRWLLVGDEGGHIHLVAAQRPLPQGGAHAFAAAAAASHLHVRLRGALWTRSELLAMAAEDRDLGPDLPALLQACERSAPLLTWGALIGALHRCCRAGLPRDQYEQAARAAESLVHEDATHALSWCVLLLAKVRLGEADRAQALAATVTQCDSERLYEAYVCAAQALAMHLAGRDGEARSELVRLRAFAASDPDRPYVIALLHEVEGLLR